MSRIRQGEWPLVGADTMRALDRHTIDDLGVAGDLLMESAGRSVAATVLEQLHALGRLPDLEARIVCGTGNNGGDGFVVARHLKQSGVAARIVLVGDEARVQGEARANLDRARAVGVAVEAPPWRAPGAGVQVDALFGTGLAREVEGAAREAIEAMNSARGRRVRTVSVDLPSGLDADTGQVLGGAVQADVTVTIGLPKLGLVLEPGRSFAGQVVVARIGIADSAPAADPQVTLWTRAAAGRRLPERGAGGHKGSFGHLLLVAGSEGKTGAAALAACGAGRAGVGLVTIACPASLNDILEVKCTEAMTVPVAETRDRSFAVAAEPTLLALAAERDVVAAGPGVGRNPETSSLMRSLALAVEGPLVLDADAIVAFTKEPGLLKQRRAATILTPHPGEAARLLDRSASEINGDRIRSARDLARITGSVVLLKGAASVAAAPDGEAIVNPTGGPILGTGGTGDVLLGVVSAYVAQGLAPLEAAAAAAYVHGAAADDLSETYGDAGLMAAELASQLPAAAARLRRAASAAESEEISEGAGDRESGFSLRFPEP